MPSGGFTCDEIAMCLEVSSTKATQAWDPAFRKVVDVMRHYPWRTLRALIDELQQIPPSDERITEAELLVLRAETQRRNGKVRRVS